MANTTARLYIRNHSGFSTLPKKLVDLPTGQSFYLVWYEGQRKRALSVGCFADKAQVALINKRSELCKAAINPQAQGQRKTPQSDASEKPQLAEAATEYITRVKKSKKHKTFLAYNRAVMDFVSVVGDKSTADLTRKDVLQFIDWMRDKDADDRTIYNRLTHLKTFFTEYSLPWPLLKTDRIKYTEPLVRATASERCRWDRLHGRLAAALLAPLEPGHLCAASNCRAAHASDLESPESKLHWQDCCAPSGRRPDHRVLRLRLAALTAIRF